MKIFLMFVLLAVTALALQAQQPTNISAFTETNYDAYIHYRLSPTNMSDLATAIVSHVAGTSLVVSSDALPSKTKNDIPKGQYEIINLRPPVAMSDGFTHTFYIDPITGEYWVLKTGGFAGVQELYGPGKLEKAGEQAVPGYPPQGVGSPDP